MSYTAVIFDLDGTLLDTLDDLEASTNHALTCHGLPKRTRDEVRQFVGNGIYNLIRQAVPEGSSLQLIDAVHETFDAHYAAHHLDRTAPYPGVCDALARLREDGMELCVVSNKGDYAVQPLVEHFFPGTFAMACGEREKDGIRRKPWPDTVLACMRGVGVAPERCVYVGDSEVDVLTARNAGIDCVIVTWGFRDEDFVRAAGGRVFVHDTDEMCRVLEA